MKLHKSITINNDEIRALLCFWALDFGMSLKPDVWKFDSKGLAVEATAELPDETPQMLPKNSQALTGGGHRS